MAEARKCDRCHEFYDIPKEQQGRDKPYDFKGDYVKILVNYNSKKYPENIRWFDLCPKCVEELDEWLANPNIQVPTLGAALRRDLGVGNVQDDCKDPCIGCINCHCEQCDYGYISVEERIKRYKKNKEEV